MKVKDFVDHMNDHGTKPRIRVLVEHDDDMMLLVFEGRPVYLDAETLKLKINSFTILGEGLIEIYAKK